MLAKLTNGQVDIMRNWMMHRQARLAALMSVCMIIQRQTGDAGFINDEIMDCHDAMEYYGTCIRTGYTD